MLCTVGIVLGGLELYSWHNGVRWKPEDIKDLIASDSPARTAALFAFECFKSLFQYGSIFVGLLALLFAVGKTEKIATIIQDFRAARGPIYDLGNTITTTNGTVSKLSREVDRLSDLEPKMREMAEKIEDIFAQIANLQRFTVSERTDTPDAIQNTPDGAVTHAPSASDAERDAQNWERLRELWNKNCERLEAVMSSIANGRTRAKFLRLPRTNYQTIIDALADQDYITEAARKASGELHKTFMSYKPRNRKIPDQAIGSVEVLDRMLEREIVVAAKAEEFA